MQLNMWHSTSAEEIEKKKSVGSEPITLFVDGASRGNPGHAGAGIVIFKGKELVFSEGFYLGTCTNNEAEYWALLLGLQVLFNLELQGVPVLIFSDSQLLVRQLQGEYRVKSESLKKFFQRAKQMLSLLSYSVRHVLRDCNTQADAMANKGIDTLNPIPVRLLEQLRILV